MEKVAKYGKNHSLDFLMDWHTTPSDDKTSTSSLENPCSKSISVVFSPISGSGTLTLAWAGVLDSLGAGTCIKKIS